MTGRRTALLAAAALAGAVLASAAAAESARPFDMTPEKEAIPAPPAAGAPATAAPAGPAPSLQAAPAENLIQPAPAAVPQLPVLQAMPPALDLRPAAPAAVMPAAPEPRQADSLSLDRFIVPSRSLRLAGEMDRRSWSISLTADEAARAARLVVTYTNAVLVMPEGSRLGVSINGQRILDQPIAASAKPAQIAADVPRGTLRAGANLIRFEVVQRHRTDCSVQSTYELWTEIEGTKTGLRFDGGEPHGPLGLDDLAAIGFDADGTTHLRLVVPHGAENSAGSDLIRLVQAVTLRGLYPHPVVTLAELPTAKPQAGTLDIVVAAAPEFATLVADAPRDAASRPTAAFLTPRGTTIPLLAISGPTWTDVATAIDFIAERVDRPVNVPRTVIDTASWLAPSPPLIVGERTLTLSDLDVPTEEFNGRRLQATFHVALPSDFYANAYGEGRLYLDAAFTEAVRPGSHVDVTVNGFLAANLPLTAPSGDILKRLPVKVSLAHFRPGVNEVTIEAVLDTATDESCPPGASAGGPPRFVLFDTTSFSMPDFARLGRWPNLSALIGTGFPYSRNVERTAVVLGRSDRDTYAAAATLLARLALAAGRVIAVDTGVSAETVGARSAIFVGAVGQFSSVTLASLGLAENVKDTWTQRPNYSPAGAAPTIDPTGIRARDTGDGFGAGTSEIYRRWNEHLVNPSGLRGQWAGFRDWLHRTFDFSLSSLSLLSTREPSYDPPRRATIVIGQVTGPAAGQDWTYLLAPTSSALVSGVAEITSVANWDEIRGRVAAFDADTETFDVADTGSFEFIATGSFSFGNLRLIAANWLSVNISTYAILVVMLCIVLGVCTSALLARLGRRS